ncbi:hypothetical protein BDV12DRAFT_184633 [Aspergillus spectabilis]
MFCSSILTYKQSTCPPFPPPPENTLPVLVFAEGDCANNGIAFEPFLTNIASYGFIVLALGSPNGTGPIFQNAMDEAVSWIQVQAGDKQGKYRRRCRANDAVSLLGIFNSGLLGNTTDTQENLPEGMIFEEPEVIGEVRKPVFWDPDGGAFGVAAVRWLEWALKGDKNASNFFTRGGVERAGWIETDSWGL